MKTHRQWWITGGLAIALVCVVIFAIALLGPATGNVFSNIVSNMPVEPYPTKEKSSSGGIKVSYAVNQPAMIIKDGSINLLVEDTDRALEQVIALAKEQEGYVISSSTDMDGQYKNAEIRLGVPAGVFEQTMNALRRIGLQVLSESSSGQDVSAEYADLKIRLANLEATAERVRGFLQDAKTVEEALKVNTSLSQLEGEIEKIKGMMKFYEGRSAYSTINVQLSPQRPTPTPTVTPGWNPSQTFREASITSVLLMQGIVNILIWVVVLFWPLALLAAIIWLATWMYKKLKKKQAVEQGDPKEQS